MNLPKIVANFRTTLSDELAVAGSSFAVDSIASEHGNLPAGVYAITIDEGTDDEEHIIGTLSSSTFSSLVRDVSVLDGETSQSTGRKHRRGAQVKITNFALIQIQRVLFGDLALTGTAPMRYGLAHTFSNARDLVDKAYVLSVVNGGAINFDQHIITGNAGETVADKDFVYFKTSDQEWYKIDADAAATSEGIKLGIAMGAGTDGNAISGGILLLGYKSGFTGLTAGAKYYLSSTAGAIVTPAPASPAKSVFVGWAKSTTELIFAPHELDHLTALEKTRATQAAPTGMIAVFSGAAGSIPAGWFLCDGQAVSRTTYADLFALIGTTYGSGDGSSTFNVPNLKGRVIVGLDGAQTEFDTLAETGGAKTHTLTTAQLPAHSHAITAHNAGDGNSAVDGSADTSNAFTSAEPTGETGGGEAHNNLQPYMVMHYMIKT